MRILLLMCAVVIGVLATPRVSVQASAALPAAPLPAAIAQAQEIDDNDDTRVEVQLVVLGIAIGTVFVFGTALYFLRRRLGLVPPPPDQSDGHHERRREPSA
jgi:hypothetical protein